MSSASPRALAEPVQFMESMEAQGQKVGVIFSKTLYMDENGVVFGEKRFPFPFLRGEAQNGLIPRRWGEFVVIFSPLYPFVHGASVVRKACWDGAERSTYAPVWRRPLRRVVYAARDAQPKVAGGLSTNTGPSISHPSRELYAIDGQARAFGLIFLTSSTNRFTAKVSSYF